MDYQAKVDFLVKNDPGLSLHFQTQFLGISRSRFYYQPAKLNTDDIRIMNLVDKIFTDYPFYGSRRITDELRQV